MKITILSLVGLVCVSCGGEPFSSSDLFEIVEDAANDAVDAAVSPTDADASQDAVAYVTDAYVARGDACTPMTKAWTCSSSSPPISIVIDGPATFCVANFDNHPVSPRVTPAECQCQETYNCACIMALTSNPCGFGDASAMTCSDQGFGPEIECP